MEKPLQIRKNKGFVQYAEIPTGVVAVDWPVQMYRLPRLGKGRSLTAECGQLFSQVLIDFLLFSLSRPVSPARCTTIG